MTAAVVVAVVVLVIGVLYARDQLTNPYWAREAEPERAPATIVIEIGGSTVHHHHHETTNVHLPPAPEVLTGEVIEPHPPRRHLPPPDRQRLP